MKAPLRISHDQLGLVMTGQRPRPALGVEFPAQRIETTLEWDDLVLHPSTQRQIEEIQTFLRHGDTLMHDWGMANRLRPGHRALFYGPPGTGKTMSAALLGKLADREVYRIDLSLVISKFIGETEKNLARVFDRAQQRGWILLFDEADALFGKRSSTRDAHDRYANQEVAYLLQRIEVFDGISILASNLRDNLDDAFTRRFESVVYFPLPRPVERLRLWSRGFSPRARLHRDVDLDALAREHELSGGSIMNVIRQVSLQAIAAGEREITRDDLQQAVRRELAKESRAS
jgi:SpoVK/Ycf46/Vps4 family AAA+-type ATPase